MKKLEKTLVVTIYWNSRKNGLKNGFTQNQKSANLSKKIINYPFIRIFSLREEFCVDKMKYCCSDKTKFGRNCERNCPTNKKGEICGNKGTCLGGGDKMGLGICECETGNFKNSGKNQKLKENFGKKFFRIFFHFLKS